MCTGCADLTKPTSALCLDHTLAVLDTTGLHAQQLVASVLALSAVPSSYVLTDILLYCLSGEM